MDCAIDVAPLVRKAREEFSSYISGLLSDYESRSQWRKDRGLPVISFVGHGRCGKDVAACTLASYTELEYAGSCSQIALPMIAWALDLSEENCWKHRHQQRHIWFNWLNEFRKDDPSLLVKMLLGSADIVAGTRAKPELLASVEEDLVDYVIWINRLEIPADPTMEYDAGDVLLLDRWGWIDNNLTLDKFRDTVKELAGSLNLKLFFHHKE